MVTNNIFLVGKYPITILEIQLWNNMDMDKKTDSINLNHLELLENK